MLITTALTSMLLAGSAEGSAQESCEVHIFPTTDIGFGTKLGNYGMLSEAFAGAAPPKKVILRSLPSDVQFEAAKYGIAHNVRLSGYNVVTHERNIDHKSATKSKMRFTSSQNKCYAELIMTNIVYSDTVLTAKKIGVLSVLREYTDSPQMPKITQLGGAAKLQMFPTDDEATSDAVKADVADGFKEAFRQSFEKFLKPKR